MRSPHVNLLLLALPENGRHVETAGTYTVYATDSRIRLTMMAELQKFSHLNRIKLQYDYWDPRRKNTNHI